MFSGSIVALVTPMEENGAIDWDAYERFIEWQLEQGTDGLVVLGTTGESPSITAEERVELIKRAVAKAGGRVPVIVGTGANSTAVTIQHTQQAAELGADAALIVTPYYNKPPQAGLIAHFKAVAESTHLPIILYNVPGRTGCDMLPETAAELGQLSNIVAMKEATGDLSRVAAYKQLGADLVLLSGDDGSCEQFIELGGQGVISVAANIAPRAMHELCQLAMSKSTEAADLQQKLNPLFDAMGLQSNPIPVKWAAAEMDLIPTGIRLPLLPLDPAYHDKVLQAMRQADLTQ
jgi:4-hydroxy-tetrahydrodipicolinate synthase